MLKNNVLFIGLIVLLPTLAQGALPQIRLTDDPVEILSVAELRVNPGFENTGTCHRDDKAANASFFNLDVIRQNSNRWIMAVQGSPTISGCGPDVGNSNGVSDQVYLYMTKDGPLGFWTPIKHRLGDPTEEISCTDSKQSNIGLYANGQGDIKDCELEEGFWGTGSLTRTVRTQYLLFSAETGPIVGVTGEPSFKSYFRIMQGNGDFLPEPRKLIMDTEAFGNAHAKPYFFRSSSNDLYLPFFFVHFDPIGFSGGGWGLGALRFPTTTTFPQVYSSWVQDGATSSTQLPTATRSLSFAPWDLTKASGHPSGIKLAYFGTVVTPWTPLNGSTGFQNDYTVIYTAVRNGDGPSCEGEIEGTDHQPKESLIGYSSFTMSTDGSVPIFGGWGEHKLVQHHDGSLVRRDGFGALSHVSLVPTSASGGYIFWTESTRCSEPLERKVVYASEYEFQ